MIKDERIWNTGKVKIGSKAPKPPVMQDADADQLQRALLATGPMRVNWENVMLIASVFGVAFMVFAGMAGWLPGGQ